MEVFVVHINWRERQHEIKVFETKVKACGFIRNELLNHTFPDGALPILRHNKRALTLDEVMKIIDKKGFYLNDWFGDDHICPFTVELMKRYIA